MPLLSKSDLKYTYSWTAINGDDSRVSGPPDDTLLNRNEGYEVLYLINKYAEKSAFKLKASGLKTERMIKVGLPSNVRSQKNVVTWLTEHWKEY